jgi:hypothetical protein
MKVAALPFRKSFKFKKNETTRKRGENDVKGRPMPEHFFLEWRQIILPLAAVIYLYILWRLEKWQLKRREFTDSERLAILARNRGCSEYDIFLLSAKQWSVTEKKVYEDFKDYVTKGDMPFYARDYVRKQGDIHIKQTGTR